MSEFECTLLDASRVYHCTRVQCLDINHTILGLVAYLWLWVAPDWKRTAAAANVAHNELN